MRPVRGANHLLAMLRERGWGVALATGAWRRAAEFKLTAAGLDTGDVPRATAEDGPARVDIVNTAILRAERHYASTFARIVMVGDGAWDVDTARALGLPFVGVAHGARADRLRTDGAMCIIPDFSAVLDVIQRFEEASVPLGAPLGVR
jgi:phosphoglycolate phosphatase-like HAD superfamily hydrolase